MRTNDTAIASIIMAAGRGSRMKGFSKNKTLLPLIPGATVFEGRRPILSHILERLPAGRKLVVVHHRKEDVISATRERGVEYCEQPVLNGTGGAVLAAKPFLEKLDSTIVIITMGDVPFVKQSTYLRLSEAISRHPMVVLGFSPREKKQYGVIEIVDGRVRRITEWKYWKEYPEPVQKSLTICNSGIYAVRTGELIRYLAVMAGRPQRVTKEIDGKKVAFDEYFLTDLIEYMVADGLSVGCLLVDDPDETMGVDDVCALEKAQNLYGRRPDFK